MQKLVILVLLSQCLLAAPPKGSKKSRIAELKTEREKVLYAFRTDCQETHELVTSSVPLAVSYLAALTFDKAEEARQEITGELDEMAAKGGMKHHR